VAANVFATRRTSSVRQSASARWGWRRTGQRAGGAIASNQVFQNGFAQGFTLAQIPIGARQGAIAVPGYYVTPDNFQTIRVVE